MKKQSLWDTERFWLLIAVGVSSCLLFRWLLIENHGLYGDEAAFVTIFKTGYGKVAGSESILELFSNLYFFNPTYPSVLYWLSAPFYILSPNFVFSLRVFMAIVHILAVFVFYKTLLKISSPILAGSGCLMLMASTYWVIRSHFYLTDGLVSLEIITTVYLFSRYLNTKSIINLALISIFIGFCLLTKFSFPIYLLPFMLVWFFTELFDSGLISVKSLIQKIAMIVGIVSFIAGPWYLKHFFSGANIISAYNENQVNIRKQTNAIESIFSWFRYETYDIPKYFFILILLLLLIILVESVKNKIFTIKNEIFTCNIFSSKDEQFIVLSSITYIVIVSAVIEFLGRTWIDRWNFSSYFIIIIIVWLSSKVKTGKKYLPVIFLPILFTLIHVHFLRLNEVKLLQGKGLIEKVNLWSIPNPLPANADYIVHSIARHNTARGGRPYTASGANFHCHEFAHNTIFKCLDFMHGNKLAIWRYLYEPWSDKPIEVENILGLDEPSAAGSYIILWKENLENKKILEPWSDLFRNLPESFWNSTEKVAQIESRPKGGPVNFDIFYIGKAKIKPNLLYQLSKIAEQVDKPLHKEYHRLKKICYGLTAEIEPLENLLAEGIKILADHKNSPSWPGDARLNMKALLLTHKLHNLIALNTKSNVYNSVFDKIYKSPDHVINNNNLNIVLLQQITSVEPNGDFQAAGDDPALYFDITKPKKDHYYTMRVRIEVPSSTVMQAYYKPSNESKFSDNFSQSCVISKGPGECYFYLNNEIFDGHLRLDPGMVSGNYRFNEIAIYESIIPPVAK